MQFGRLLKRAILVRLVPDYFLSLRGERTKVRVIDGFEGGGLRYFKEAAKQATPTLTLPPPKGREAAFQRPVGRALVFLLALFSLPAIAQKADCRVNLARSEKFWVQGKYKESDLELAEAEKICPNNAEIYWRKARNIFSKIDSLPMDKRPRKTELIDAYEEMFRQAQKCAELDPENGMCWEHMAISLGMLCKVRNLVRVMREADDLERYLKKAESLHPIYRAENGAADAMADIYNGLAQFYRQVPDSRITGSMVGARGDIEKSVEYERKAVALEPRHIEYLKELGVSLICYSYRKKSPAAMEEGMKYLAGLLDLPNVKYSDAEDKVHARVLQTPSGAGLLLFILRPGDAQRD